MRHTTNADRIRTSAKAHGWTEVKVADDELVFHKGNSGVTVHLHRDTIFSAATHDLANPHLLSHWAVQSHHHHKLDRIRTILGTEL